MHGAQEMYIIKAKVSNAQCNRKYINVKIKVKTVNLKMTYMSLTFIYRSMDEYRQRLLHLCRVCERRELHTKRQSNECKMYSEQLHGPFGIDVGDNNASIHPPPFCTEFFDVIVRFYCY